MSDRVQAPKQTNSTTRTTLMVVLALLPSLGVIGTGSAAASEPAVAAPIERPAVAVHGAEPALSDRLSWAIDRFSTAGLELPDLVISFHDTNQDAAGAAASTE